MNKTQVEELAALQKSIFDAVAQCDQGKLLQQLEVTTFWIRKQIWQEVSAIMFDCGDPVKAANYQVADVGLSKGVLVAFNLYQQRLVVSQGKGYDEDYRRRRWLEYVNFIAAHIDMEVSTKKSQYITISVKRTK